MVLTVKDQLLEIAENQGLTFEEVVDEQLSPMIEPSVPERFRCLVLEVVLRLHARTDYSPAMWRVEADEKQIAPNCYTFLDCTEERDLGYPEFVIKISPLKMGRLSDAACRWILAQSFAYIASKLLPTSSEGSGEDEPLPSWSEEQVMINTIALGWGFECECAAYLDQICAGAKTETGLNSGREFDETEGIDKEIHSENKNISRLIH